MSFASLPPLAWIGLGVVVCIILLLLFRRAPSAPQYVQSAPRRKGIGWFTWILLLAVVVLLIPQLPWLLAHLSLIAKPAQLSFTSPLSVNVSPAAPPSDSIVGAPTITA